MKYEPTPQIKEKLTMYSESDANTIVGCLSLWNYLTNLDNTRAQEPIATDDETIRAGIDELWKMTENISFMPTNCRIVSINALHKSSAGFKSKTKSELNEALNRLQTVGVVSETTFAAIGTKSSKEVRYVSPLWLVGAGATFDDLEEKLFDLLARQLQSVTDCQSSIKSAYDGQPVRLLKDCYISFGYSSWMGKAGTIIEDYTLARHLFEIGAPVVSITESDMAMCPACNNRFAVTAEQSENLTVLICLQDLTFWYRGSTIKRSRGEIEADTFLVQYMLDARLPVAQARIDEYGVCPRSDCKRIFARETLLGKQQMPVHLQSPAPIVVAQPITVGSGGASVAQDVKTFPPIQDPFLKPLPDNMPVNEHFENRFPETF